MTIIPSQYNVAVICGGVSGEREVSLRSGEGAQEALVQAGFRATLLDSKLKSDLVRLIEEPFDVAFLCLHGRGGEDGAIQGFLETIGLPYTGSGVLSSAQALHKATTKKIYGDAGIPTPAAAYLDQQDDIDLNGILEKVGEHCVVKPATEGSSIGVSIVTGARELQNALKEAFRYDRTVVVESFVDGVEATVSVLGNNELQPLPVIKMIPRNDFYDYESKYAPGGSEHICPAPFDETLTQHLQELACAAHHALGCKGVSRTDFIIDEAGDPWCLETNTIPGMTATSLLPDAALVAGMTFPQVCMRLVELALE